MNPFSKLQCRDGFPAANQSALSSDRRSGKIPLIHLVLMGLFLCFLVSCSESGSDFETTQYENFYVVNASQATFSATDTASENVVRSEGATYSVTLTDVPETCIRFEDRPGTGVTTISLASLLEAFQTGNSFQIDPPNATLRFHVNQGTEDETYYNAVVRINGVTTSSDDENTLDLNVTLLNATSKNMGSSGEENTSIWDSRGANFSVLPEQGEDVSLVLAGHLTDPSEEIPEWLYWQNAGSGTFETTETGYSLVLKDIPPRLVKFSVEPERLVKNTTRNDLLRNWGQNQPFSLSPPNALIRFHREDGGDFINMVVTITQARYYSETEEMILDITTVPQTWSQSPAVFDSANRTTALPESGKDFTLFIDDAYSCSNQETLNDYTRAYENVNWGDYKGRTQVALLIWNLTMFPSSTDVQDNLNAQYNTSCVGEDQPSWSCGGPACPLVFEIGDLGEDSIIEDNHGKIVDTGLSDQGEWKNDIYSDEWLYPGEMLWITFAAKGTGTGDTRVHFKNLNLTSVGPAQESLSFNNSGTITFELNYDMNDDSGFNVSEESGYFKYTNDPIMVNGISPIILYWHAQESGEGTLYEFLNNFERLYNAEKDANLLGSFGYYSKLTANIMKYLGALVEDLVEDYRIVIVMGLMTEKSCFCFSGMNACYPSSNPTKYACESAYDNADDDSELLTLLNLGTVKKGWFQASSPVPSLLSLRPRPDFVIQGH